jgi:hypothetical protein
MKNKNKRIVIIFCAVLVLLSATGITFSYMKDSQTVKNVISIGNVTIETKEPGWNSGAEAKTIAPGQIVVKDPYVTNTGVNPCYVRIRIDMPQIGGKDLFVLGNGGSGSFAAINFYTAEQSGIKEYWLKSGGYYYYKNSETADILNPEKFTPKLFTAIMLSDDIDEGDFGAGSAVRNIEIYTEAVQSQSFKNSVAAWAAVDSR